MYIMGCVDTTDSERHCSDLNNHKRIIFAKQLEWAQSGGTESNIGVPYVMLQ